MFNIALFIWTLKSSSLSFIDANSIKQSFICTFFIQFIMDYFSFWYLLCRFNNPLKKNIAGHTREKCFVHFCSIRIRIPGLCSGGLRFNRFWTMSGLCINESLTKKADRCIVLIKVFLGKLAFGINCVKENYNIIL